MTRRRLHRSAMLWITAAITLLLLGIVPASPAFAVSAIPNSPLGWHIEKLVETDQPSAFRFNNGLLAVPSKVIDQRAWEFSWNIYRLGLEPADSPLAGVLPDVFTGTSVVLDQNLFAFTVPKPGLDPETGSTDIYVQELSGGAPRLLTKDSPEYPGGVKVDGNHVVWSEWGFHHEGEIMLYDNLTGITKNLTPNPPGSNTAPDIDGDDVVWQLWNGVTHWIYHYRISTGKTEELARGIPWTPGLSPQVENGRVIWITHQWLTPAEGQYSLYLRDLDGTSNQVIETSSGFQSAVLVGDLLLMTTSEDSEHFERSVRNLATGKSRVLSVSGLNPSLVPFHSSSLEGDMIAYEATEPLPSGVGYHGRIFVYDGNTDELTQIAEGDNLGLVQLDRERVLFTQATSLDDSRAYILWLAVKDGAPSYDRFLDVPPPQPFHDQILSLSDRGVVGGYGTAPFLAYKPSLPLLRAQYAKMLVTALGLHDEEWTNWGRPTFKDVPSPTVQGEANRYPFDYVEEATKAGLIQGLSTDSFAPWQEITRVQLALMLARAGKAKLDEPAAPTPFADIWGLSVEAREAIRWCYANGIVSGKTATTFAPFAKATRGQAAKMTWGLLRALGQD